MFKFVNDVNAWMNADNSNVVAIHCKGGKGRTGTMICTWLIESGQFSEAKVSRVALIKRKRKVKFFVKF